MYTETHPDQKADLKFFIITISAIEVENCLALVEVSYMEHFVLKFPKCFCQVGMFQLTKCTTKLMMVSETGPKLESKQHIHSLYKSPG